MFGELARRNLPAKDARATPSFVYIEETYLLKRLSQYYKTNAKIAKRQGAAPSLSVKPSRHNTTIYNNAMFRKRTSNVVSSLDIKTTTNNNRWAKPTTKTLKRPDEQ